MSQLRLIIQSFPLSKKKPATSMAEALISPILEQITTILGSQVNQHLQLIAGVDKEIQKLRSNLSAIQAFVEDAERRQLREAGVRDWLGKLKQVSYDMEDMLEEWSTVILKREIEEAVESTYSVSKRTWVCSFLSSPCFCFNPLIYRHYNGVKIREITERLSVINEEKSRYGFDVYKAIEEPERPITTHLVDVSRVRGRDEDKKSLISKLLCENSHGVGEILVISIVGMGGIGKTTLAQLAFNDGEVKVHFEERIWVCVSEPFDQINIAKAILNALGNSLSEADVMLLAFSEQIGKSNMEKKHLLETFVDRIGKSIEKKKFLLVFDDVWNDDYAKWEPLKLSLKRGAPGSRILVTTRNENVVKMMETTHRFDLAQLSDEECWSLFSLVAFDGRSEEEREKLVEIGRKIAGKAKGLPLAAKTLGGLMQFKRGKEQWENVLSSELWELEELVGRGLFPPLLLSYYDLPAAVRRCFTYCASFPKEHTIEKGELIKLWMAQGYLKATSSKEMELVGEEYFQNLAVRSFFHYFEEFPYPDDHATKFKMHDIVHDFAQFLSKDECFSCTRKENMGSFCETAHYASMRYCSRQNLQGICNSKKLRSLLINGGGHSLGEALHSLFCNLRYLRSLDVSGSEIEEIPIELGQLTHLRYLNFDGCSILKLLPESISELCNLQSLRVSGCWSLKRLPRGMQKLLKLRHLTIHMLIEFLPKGIERLSCLRTLPHFRVGDSSNENEAAKLGELEELNQLQGKLTIWDLAKVTDANDAIRAQLKNKTRVTALKLYFCEDGNDLKDEDAILEALQPPPELEYLRIQDYRGTLCPNWMVSLSKLTQLHIWFCDRVQDWRPLARLPSLERLTLFHVQMKSSRNHGDSSSSVTEFPKLKLLHISTMVELEELDIARSMPQLGDLKIYDCPKMKTLPDCILTAPLWKLHINGCPILEERYSEENGEEWHKISHIRHIYIF